jgi:hypothetical protein
LFSIEGEGWEWNTCERREVVEGTKGTKERKKLDKGLRYKEESCPVWFQLLFLLILLWKGTIQNTFWNVHLFPSRAMISIWKCFYCVTFLTRKCNLNHPFYLCGEDFTWPGLRSLDSYRRIWTVCWFKYKTQAINYW